MTQAETKAEVEEFLAKARAAGQSDAKSVIGIVAGLIHAICGSHNGLIVEGKLSVREANLLTTQGNVVMEYLVATLDVLDPQTKVEDLN